MGYRNLLDNCLRFCLLRFSFRTEKVAWMSYERSSILQNTSSWMWLFLALPKILYFRFVIFKTKFRIFKSSIYIMLTKSQGAMFLLLDLVLSPICTRLKECTAYSSNYVLACSYILFSVGEPFTCSWYFLRKYIFL